MFTGTFPLGARKTYRALWNRQHGLGLKLAGTYAIEHVETGVAYVGSTTHLFDRWHKHQWHLEHRNHSCMPLQKLFDDEGVDAFVFRILTTTAKSSELLGMEHADGLRVYGMDALLNYRLGAEWLGHTIPHECYGRGYGYRRATAALA